MTKARMFNQWQMYFLDDYYDINDMSGEWLIFFSLDAWNYVNEKCFMAVDTGIVKRAKIVSLLNVQASGQGVACFKIDNSNGVNVEEHKLLLQFLLDNNLITKTKSGNYTNIRFKVLADGKGTHKGDDWNGFTLNQFIDLSTGQFII